MTVRFGLIGCGRISQQHIISLSQLSNAKLTAVSDIVPDRMNQAVELHHELTGQLSEVKKNDHYETILHDKEIDVVIIATVSFLHASIAKQALLNGKHVIIEKPIALSLSDAREIMHLSTKYKLKVMVCHQLRFRPLLQKIKSIVDAGSLGPIHLGSINLRINRDQQYYEQASWRGSWLKDGGMLINQGIHMIDLLIWLLGDVKSAYGELSFIHQNKQTEDLALGLLQFENGAKGLLEANTITQPDNFGYSLSLFGERGTIIIGGKNLDQVNRWYIENDVTDTDVLKMIVPEQNAHVLMYSQFIESYISRSEKILVDAYEGTRALETIFGIYQSAQSRKPISFPIEQFDTGMMVGQKGDF